MFPFLPEESGVEEMRIFDTLEINVVYKQLMWMFSILFYLLNFKVNPFIPTITQSHIDSLREAGKPSWYRMKAASAVSLKKFEFLQSLKTKSLSLFTQYIGISHLRDINFVTKLEMCSCRFLCENHNALLLNFWRSNTFLQPKLKTFS